MPTEPRVIIALDAGSARAGLEIAARLDPADCHLKVGFELFVAAGPAVVESLASRGFRVFLDLKFHDIPNTVAGACRSAAASGAWMLNVHALGGEAMMAAAAGALAAVDHPPLLVAVTLLTSHGPAELAALGVSDAPAGVAALAARAAGCGLDGVVCAAAEAPAVRREQGKSFVIVTPGVRPAGAERGDQQRVVSPRQAVALGADYLVIGRPVTAAGNPAEALAAINREIAS
ncbi:MAG: orotidine-5'-phosphate decarboxylase [Gammaproteobacteria bacterium]|nr:orotidine-5'-phosphate decarboxylase [Gammaproteobacteria bacterium]